KLEIENKRKRYYEDVVNFTPIVGKEPYKNYQIEDIKRYLNINRGGIFWEQGLGKAVFLAVHLTQLFKNNEVDKAVILSPSSGIYNLRREILKFSNLFSIDDIVIASKDNREPFIENAKIVIMTYRTFLLISDHYYKKNNPSSRAKKYRKPCIPFDDWIKNKGVIYLDESHNIANPQARQSHVIHLHKHYFYYRYVLSGTPADRVNKYYSQIKFLDNNLIPYSYNEWLPTVCNIGNRFSQYAINYEYPDKVANFIDSVTPYIVQRKAKDHLDLPENFIKKIYFPLSKKQDSIYRKLIKVTLKTIKQEHGSLDMRAITNNFPFISLALDNPEIINLDKYIGTEEIETLLKMWKFEDHSKLEIFDDLVEEIVKNNNEKFIIWSGHPKTIDSLAEHYKKYKPLKIHGNIDFKSEGHTRDSYRDMVVETFKNTNKNLLIASWRVLDTAVTMTECNKQGYFDRGWDLIPWLQSQKRIHRISQEKQVTTYVTIFENTLEERQDRILERKENMNNNLLNKDFMTKEEWEKLFNGDDV
ncbi:MAG: SNF2-related protein, partial [Spirochaetota bacterium]